MPTDSENAAPASQEASVQPVFQSRRLQMRMMAEEDAPAVFEAVEASRGLLRRRLRWSAACMSPEDEARFIASAKSGSALTWGIFGARTGKFVGVISLDRPLIPESAELEGWVRSELQDRGYFTEAGKFAIEHGFRKFNIHRFYARLDPTNRAFRKALKKLAFRYEGCLRDDKRINGRWVDQECWGLLRAEWKR